MLASVRDCSLDSVYNQRLDDPKKEFQKEKENRKNNQKSNLKSEFLYLFKTRLSRIIRIEANFKEN